MSDFIQNQTLNLGGDIDIDPIDWSKNAPRKLWMSLFLLAIYDRATEIRLEPSRGKSALCYYAGGEWWPLVPPPEDWGPAMIGEIHDLSRPKGARAWLIRLLRKIIWRLERPYGLSDAYFDLKLGGHTIPVFTATDSEWSLILRFQPPTELSDEAKELLAAQAARIKARTKEEAARPEGEDTSGLVGDVTSSLGPGSS